MHNVFSTTYIAPLPKRPLVMSCPVHLSYTNVENAEHKSISELYTIHALLVHLLCHHHTTAANGGQPSPATFYFPRHITGNAFQLLALGDWSNRMQMLRAHMSH